MKISEPARSVRISDLPTPRLRARAIELALLSVGPDYIHEELDLLAAFNWTDESHEGHNFWAACNWEAWDEAKELQPSLFKPIDGKPHIKLTAMELNTPIDGASVLHAMDSDYVDILDGDRAYDYCLDVNPKWYPTIQEAVDALYSFKREES